jgi:hypothetical protein
MRAPIPATGTGPVVVGSLPPSPRADTIPPSPRADTRHPRLVSGFLVSMIWDDGYTGLFSKENKDQAVSQFVWDIFIVQNCK